MKLAPLLAAAGTVVALAAPATAGQAATDQPAAQTVETINKGRLEAQARAQGLSSAQAATLQADVDRVVARTGGRQVAINQVVWDGGDTLVPLPGQRRARELNASESAGPTVYGCKYLQFCTYSSNHYTGMVDRVSSCTRHESHAFFRSYVNNQTRGTRARFLRGDGKLLSRTQPAPATGTTSLGAAFYIRPC
jgi:hypothetical protein